MGTRAADDVGSAMKQTTRCVRCFRKAKFWSGHILRKHKHVLAGWCGKACSQAEGFSGHWTKKMGKQDWRD